MIRGQRCVHGQLLSEHCEACYAGCKHNCNAFDDLLIAAKEASKVLEQHKPAYAMLAGRLLREAIAKAESSGA